MLATAVVAEIALRVAGNAYLRRLHVQQSTRYTRSPGAINIVALGESSTAGLWVEPELSYPAQLQRLLREQHPGREINVIVPPHVGQNTSHMANRIASYLELYRPRLVIVMAGTNNEWSLAESNLGRFLDGDSPERLRVKIALGLSQLRLYKVARFGYLKLTAASDSDEQTKLVRKQSRDHYPWGAPEFTPYPPEEWVYSFARSNRTAFVALWRADIDSILSSTHQFGAAALLMTYHAPPAYLPLSEWESMADRHHVPLVRNDVVFAELLRTESPEEYLLHDGWHPSAKGYAVIARNAHGAITELDLLNLSPQTPRDDDADL